MSRTSRTAQAPQSAIAAPRRSGNPHLRNGQSGKENENITSLENDPSVLADSNMIDPASLVTDGQERPPAVDFDDVLENPGPAVRRYRVTSVLADGRVQTSINGLRTTLRVGKEIDENNFDINLLKRQGVKLEEIALDQTG